MFTGLSIALAAALAGGIPVVQSLQRPGRERLNAIMVGMALRFVLALGLTVAGVFSGLLAARPLVVWVAIGYVALLGVETWVLVGLTRDHDGGAE